MIKISLYEGKWRIVIDETWQFENRSELTTTLDLLLRLKDINGRLK